MFCQAPTPLSPNKFGGAACAIARLGTTNHRRIIGVGACTSHGLIIRIITSAQDNRASVLLIKRPSGSAPCSGASPRKPPPGARPVPWVETRRESRLRRLWRVFRRRKRLLPGGHVRRGFRPFPSISRCGWGEVAKVGRSSGLMGGQRHRFPGGASGPLPRPQERAQATAASFARVGLTMSDTPSIQAAPPYLGG